MRTASNFLRTGLLAALLLGLLPTQAGAVPSFARQTGLACNACHTAFPELTKFGRQFKLDGYTFSGKEQVEGTGDKDNPSLRIGSIPPLSIMFQVSYTDTKGADKVQPGTRSNFDVPQQFSLFYAGEISPHLGAFLQVTHGDNTSGFGMDNSEIRYARHFDSGSGDLLLGVLVNNNPGMSDVWQSTPVWGYPFQSPLSFEKPLSWSLGQAVGGVGAYAQYDGRFYAEVDLYKTMGSGGQDTPLTDPWTGSLGGVAGWAPYWRLNYSDSFGENTFEVGLLGMDTKIYGNAAAATTANPNPVATTGPKDSFSDLGFDFQFERGFGTDSFVVRGIYSHEKAKLDAYRVTVPGQPDASFHVLNLNGSYHFGNAVSLSAGYLQTSGDAADSTTYGNGLRTGTSARLLEAAYFPWENVRLSAQYVSYTKFLGVKDNASDNNTFYVLGWFVF